MKSSMRPIYRRLVRALLPVVALVAIAAGAPAAAQKIAFEVNAPMMVTEGQQFHIEFLVVSDGDLQSTGFEGPDFPDGLNVMSGPVKSNRFDFSFNSSTGQSNRITDIYTYWIQATATGKMNIGAATVTANGQSYTSKPFTVEVVTRDQARQPQRPSGGGGQSGAGQSGGQNTAAQPARLAADDILLRMEVAKRDVYRGEPLVASLKIYTQVNISGLENPKYPSMNGFWAQEMNVSGQGDNREVVNGKVYYTQVMRQWLLYPQRAGTIEIEACEFTAHAQVVTEAPQRNDPWDIFFGAPQVRNVTTRLTTSPVQIQVRDLPRPQPANFDGAVGQFDLTAEASHSRLPANNAGSVTLRLSGTGNFPLIQAPELRLPGAAFEQYDTKTTESLSTTARGTSGSRTWEYPFIARAEGSYTVPGVEFSYFDPSTGRYVELTTPDFPVEILRDDNSGSGGLSMVSGVTKEDLQMLGQDIRYIRVGHPGLRPRGGALLWSAGWWIAALLLILGFCAALFFLQRMIRERADLSRVKTKKANKVALRRLRRAKGYMQSGKETPFFEEMLRALWGYMGDKLSIDVANLTKERVRQELELRGVEEEESREFLSLLSECEFAQYAPAAGVQMEKAYTQALDLIGRFESKI